MNRNMKRNVQFVLLLAGSVMACSAGPSMAHEGSPERSRRNEDAIFDYLLPVVYTSGKAVRLYYRSDCRTATDPVNAAVPYPFVRLQRPSKGKTGLAAVREIFEKDRNVTVTEEPAGTIRIWIGKIPTGILRAKLSRLSLNPMAQYNPDEAFNALINAKETRTAMRSLRFSSVANLSSSRAEADKSLPHLPATIRDMTAEQVLDKVAKTWAGQVVVIYGACAESERSDGLTRFWLGLAGQY